MSADFQIWYGIELESTHRELSKNVLFVNFHQVMASFVFLL